MKKNLLLLGAILTISATTFAEESGYIRTGVTTGVKENAWNAQSETTVDELKVTEWTVAEGWFKGSNWGGFGLGYSAKKSYNEDNEHDGKMKIELSPEYGKSFGFGYVSGQLGFAQERWGNMVSGSDTIKPKVSAVVNLTPKSRLEMKALYAATEATPKVGKSKQEFGEYNDVYNWKKLWTYDEITSNTDNGKSQWLEGEVQYKQEFFGGTAGAGIYYGMNKKDKFTITTKESKQEVSFDNATPGVGWYSSQTTTITTTEELSPNDNYSQINYMLNYGKYFTPIKLYASLYGEYQTFSYEYDTNDYKQKDVEKYTLGLYLNRNFDNGIGVDVEAVKKADLTKINNKAKAENTISAGIKYNF